MEHILSALMPLNDLQHVWKSKASEWAIDVRLSTKFFFRSLTLSLSLSISPKRNHKYLIDFMGNSVILSYFMPHDTDCAEESQNSE